MLCKDKAVLASKVLVYKEALKAIELQSLVLSRFKSLSKLSICRLFCVMTFQGDTD